MFQRYAIFYTPAAGPFADFAAAWLGWNSATGQAIVQPDIADLDVEQITARPRKYGFHATLKAPFHLAHTAKPDALRNALDEFVQNRSPVAMGALHVSTIHGFLALRPVDAPPALPDLAAAVVTGLDSFRAPLSADDIARRRKSRLTPRQDQQMLDWGYPHIFDDFNFHMTLSGPLRRIPQETAQSQLQSLIAPVLPAALCIDALTLMGEDRQGMFHQIHRAPLCKR